MAMRALQVNDTAIAVQVKGISNDAGKYTNDAGKYNASIAVKSYYLAKRFN